MNHEECDECGTQLISPCARCRAPVCCPLCCARSEIERLEAENAELKRLLDQAKDDDIKQLEEIAALRQQIPRWIPVSERLPEPGLHSVFKIPLKGYPDYCEAGFYQVGSNMICDLCGDPTTPIEDATHWMPLPTPPEQGN